MSNKRKAELEKEQEENKKRIKLAQEEKSTLEQRLNQLETEQKRLKEEQQKIKNELAYGEFKWLIPVQHKDLTPLEKQYNKWCKNICQRFQQDWIPLRTEIQRFHNLHFRYGWQTILMDLVNDIFSKDVIGLIVGYVMEDFPMSLLKGRHDPKSWEEVRQAMYELWRPSLSRPQKPIEFAYRLVDMNRGLGYFIYSFSYSTPWKCRNKRCKCEGEEQVISIQVEWNEFQMSFSTSSDFHCSGLNKLLVDWQIGQSIPIHSWNGLMTRALESQITPQVVPALFLVYFEPKIGWLEEWRKKR